MSNQEVQCVNELTIRFEQMENGSITWAVLPDDIVWQTRDLSLMDLAEENQPLSVMAVRALWKLCVDGMVFTSLELANATRAGICQRYLRLDQRRLLELNPASNSVN